MNVEKLICLVKEHPILYCISHPDYMITKLNNELWNKIGERNDLLKINAAQLHWVAIIHSILINP